MSGGLDMAVAISARRESLATLRATIECAMAAAALGGSAVVDVLVNGHPELADGLGAARIETPANVELRIWAMAVGDKAAAWNQYVHALWPAARATYFVDGYARVRPEAFIALAAACDAVPDALAATGLPTSGASAAALANQMEREGGLHGNLFMLTSATMRRLRERDVRLPLGIYRTDSTIGAALAFGLDPAANEWSPLRFIALAQDAKWDVDPKRWWSIAQLRSQLDRRGRQAQGDLENAAVRSRLAIEKRPPEQMPRTVEQLVVDWAAAYPDAANALLRRSSLRRAAFDRLRAGRDWSTADTPARRVEGRR